MPRQKDLKRLVRTRMKKTGESYTAARAQLTKKDVDYAALAGMSDDAVQQKTGSTWKAWVRKLDERGAAELPHRDIARMVSKEFKVQSWWSQTVTVGYERIRGLRLRGQRRDGSYEATKSRTFNVPIDALFDAWADAGVRRKWLDVDARVRTSTRPKSLRLGLADKTIIAVGFAPKGASKSQVALSHPKLPDKATVTRIKQLWSDRLDALAKVLR